MRVGSLMATQARRTADTETVTLEKSAVMDRAPTSKSTPASSLFAGVSTASWIVVRFICARKSAPASCLTTVVSKPPAIPTVCVILVPNVVTDAGARRLPRPPFPQGGLAQTLSVQASSISTMTVPVIPFAASCMSTSS